MSTTREKVILGFGLAMILLGLLSSEWCFGLLTYDHAIRLRKTLLYLFNGSFIVFGLVLIVYRRRPIAARLVLAFCTALLCLLPIEILFRLKPEWQLKNRQKGLGDVPVSTIRMADAVLHHTLKPHGSGLEQWGYWEAKAYYANSLGLRDVSSTRVVSKIPAEGYRRLLVLGDSFTEGVGVVYEKTAVHRLEQIFLGQGEKVEVLNGGVTSLCPSLEYHKLKQFIEQGYRTDAVVLLLDNSDIDNESNRYAHWNSLAEAEKTAWAADKIRRKEKRLRQLQRNLDPPWLSRWFHSYTYEYTAQILVHFLTRREGETDLSLHPHDAALWAQSKTWGKEGMKLCQSYLRQIAGLCQQQAIPFYLVIYPWPFDLPKSAGRPAEMQTILAAFCSEAKIPLLDLFPDFYAQQDWQKYFIPKDVHWNEQGHAFVAEIIYPKLKSYSLFGKSSPK